MIQMLATKMAEEMAAQKLRELLPDVATTPATTTDLASSTAVAPATDSPASKKSKEREQEKQKREEERLKREEEKRQRELKREEEKRQREQKREEEKRQRELKREEEKQKREEERLKKEEEKRKQIEEKERKQLRIASFFTVKKKPATTLVPATTSDGAIGSENSHGTDASSSTKEEKKVVSDFDANFLPFYLRANVTLCELNCFSKPPEVLMRIQTYLDTILKTNDGGANAEGSASTETKPLQDSSAREPLAEYLKARRVKRGYKLPYQTRDAVEAFNAGTAADETRLVKILQSLPQKHIAFSENVRPPYVGTFTKPVTRFPRNNPFYRIPTEETGFNYDYDSEIEWTQEDEDGEDLDMEDESDENEDFITEDDDLDGFVSSDESGAPQRRIMIAGPLTPVTVWNDGSNSAHATLAPMAVDVLAYGGNMHSIDPLYDYWTVPKKQTQPLPLQPPQQLSIAQLRAPSSSSASASTATALGSGAAAPVAVPAKKMIATADMKPFLTKIRGTEMNQIMLVETLKREFPHYSKEIIRNTIRQVARRVGEKEPNKVWEINQDVWALHAS
jgi:chromatin assembly factor 1 subunit A